MIRMIQTIFYFTFNIHFNILAEKVFAIRLGALAKLSFNCWLSTVPVLQKCLLWTCFFLHFFRLRWFYDCVICWSVFLFWICTMLSWTTFSERRLSCFPKVFARAVLAVFWNLVKIILWTTRISFSDYY